MPEHRPRIKILLRNRIGCAVMFNICASSSGGSFRTKGERCSIPILERIHFFFNDVGRSSYTPGKESRDLKNRNTDFAEAIHSSPSARRLFDEPPARGLFREKIFYPFDRFDDVHHDSPLCMNITPSRRTITAHSAASQRTQVVTVTRLNRKPRLPRREALHFLAAARCSPCVAVPCGDHNRLRYESYKSGVLAPVIWWGYSAPATVRVTRRVFYESGSIRPPCSRDRAHAAREVGLCAGTV